MEDAIEPTTKDYIFTCFLHLTNSKKSIFKRVKELSKMVDEDLSFILNAINVSRAEYEKSKDDFVIEELCKRTYQELNVFYKTITQEGGEENLKMSVKIKKAHAINQKIRDSFAIKLARIHNSFKLFSKNSFMVLEENDITKNLDDFYLLNSFYDIYKEQFSNNTNNKQNQQESRSVDLPFLGNLVLEQGKPDIIFYFEGSLSKERNLSITVLAHLWQTNKKDIIEKFCGKNKWWTKHNYNNIVDKLLMNKQIAERSYVTDAVRFKDKSLSKKLIQEEIKLFKPKLVVCVGSKARELVGMNYYDFSTKFHHVRFPKYHTENEQYIKLKKIIEKFIN